jgi:arsenate reductase
VNERGAPGQSPVRVIFVCTHNSARSVMAEALLRRRGGDGFAVVSAGTEPGSVRPETIQVLEEAGLPTATLRSKSVDEFLGQPFDYVITVCDQARQACPVFPGGRRTLHWGYPDPSEETGTEAERIAAFRAVFTALGERIATFVLIAQREREAAANVEQGR